MSPSLTNAYRTSRRTTSILCGLTIAWTAVLFEIDEVTLAALGQLRLDSALLPLVLAVLMLYSMFQTTVEYMMQEQSVRRWSLAQLDYKATLTLLRIAILLLAASVVSRSLEIVAHTFLASLIALAAYFALVFIMTLLVMPIRLMIRGGSGAAASAIESYYWSLLIVGLLYIAAIVLMGISVVRPFSLLGIEYSGITLWRLLLFSGTCLLILFSCFLEERYLAIVFATEPLYLDASYTDTQGREVRTSQLNPKHPEYEERKRSEELNAIALKYCDDIKSCHSSGISSLIAAGVIRANTSHEVEKILETIYALCKSDPLNSIRPDLEGKDLCDFFRVIRRRRFNPENDEDLRKAADIAKYRE